MLSQNAEIFEKAGVSKYHNAGILGDGVRIAVLDPEQELYHYQEGGIERPLGVSGKSGGHLGQCIAVLQQVCPAAKIYALGTSKECWEWCLDNQIDIISASYTSPSNILKNALEDRFKQSNTIIFAASGNSSKDNGADIIYPSALDFTISVGAYCPNLDKVEGYSNGGEQLDCVAYTDIAVTTNKGTTMEFNGTSAATPLVAGMVALLLSVVGKKDYKWVRDYIRMNSIDILEEGKDTKSGYGLFVLPELEDESMEIRMTIGSKVAEVNGEIKTLSLAPVEKNGTTLVPIRFVAEALGCEVEYEAASRGIVIKK